MLDYFLLYMLLGAVAGLLAGLFGLGGGAIIVPALVGLFSAQQFPSQQIMIMAVATSLATIIFTSISAILSHVKLGAISWSIVFRLSPGIFLGAGIGATVADTIDATSLKWFFISYLCYVAIRMAFKNQSSSKINPKVKWLDYVAGNFIGLLSSLLGIGGGTLTVPYLLGRQLAMKNAVAVSSACGFPIALSGTITYVILGWQKASFSIWNLGYIYLPALSGIVICSVLTAPLGAKLANKLPAKKLKRYFSGVIFLIVIKMIVGQNGL